MAYQSGGQIEAIDYNTFVNQLNAIYSDVNQGSIEETSADYGYGVFPVMPTVAITDLVTHIEWTKLFTAITNCGIHQATNVAGIPASVNVGDIIYAEPNPLISTTLPQVISALSANRLTVTPLQTQLVPDLLPTPIYTSTWTGSNPPTNSGLQYTWQIEFSSWDNARYFFNLGGALTVSSSFVPTTPPGSADEQFWQGLMAGLGVVRFEASTTSPGGAGPASTVGFYDLIDVWEATPDTYTEILKRLAVSGGVYYSSNHISILAKLAQAPGISGPCRIDFAIQFVDLSVSPDPKNGTVTLNIGYIKSSGAIPFTGSITYSPIDPITGNPVVSPAAAFTQAFVPYVTPTNVPLTAIVSPTSTTATITGAGTATTPSITVSPTGGTTPYTYSWSNVSTTPNVVVFSNPTGASTTFHQTLTNGQSLSGIAKITVTDSTPITPQVVTKNVNWSLNSNTISGLGVTIAPSNINRTQINNGTFPGQALTATAHGGVTPYTYHWINQGAGSVTISPTTFGPTSGVSNVVATSAFVPTNSTNAGTISCMVTDSASVSSNAVASYSFINAPPAAPLAVNISPSSLSGTSSAPGVVSSNTATATGSGGTAPYTYGWSLTGTSGPSVTITSSENTAHVSATLSGGSPSSTGNLVCTVTDNFSLTASSSVPFALTYSPPVVPLGIEVVLLSSSNGCTTSNNTCTATSNFGVGYTGTHYGGHGSWSWTFTASPGLVWTGTGLNGSPIATSSGPAGTYTGTLQVTGVVYDDSIPPVSYTLTSPVYNEVQLHTQGTPAHNVTPLTGHIGTVVTVTMTNYIPGQVVTYTSTGIPASGTIGTIDSSGNLTYHETMGTHSGYPYSWTETWYVNSVSTFSFTLTNNGP